MKNFNETEETEEEVALLSSSDTRVAYGELYVVPTSSDSLFNSVNCIVMSS
jgi:hypothetical protein